MLKQIFYFLKNSFGIIQKLSMTSIYFYSKNTSFLWANYETLEYVYFIVKKNETIYFEKTQKGISFPVEDCKRNG